MNIEESLYKRLSTYTSLTALVNNRIYPLVIPQDARLPAVTYQCISDPGIHTMGADSGIYSPRFQLSVWAETYPSAVAVADQVIAALKDFSGQLGGAEGVQAQRIFYDNATRFYDSQTGTYHIPIDFIIWHEGG